jgi:hypothetical protein
MVVKSMAVKWAEHVKRMGEKRNSYRVLFGNPRMWSPLGRCMSENNIKMCIKEMGGKDAD